MNQHESVCYGQGLSPYAYYSKAFNVLSSEGVIPETVRYEPLETHNDVGHKLEAPGSDALVAQDSTLIGGIQPSREAMPDVFEYRNIHAYGGVLLDVVFHKMRHPDVMPEDIGHALTMEVVAQQSSNNIKGLSVIPVLDTGDSAIALKGRGLYSNPDEGLNDIPCYAVCTKEAGEDNGLISDGIASNSRGATRFIAYRHTAEGSAEPEVEGDRQLIALRVPHEEGRLTDSLVAGFEHQSMSGLTLLNEPSEYADFSVEIKGGRSDARSCIELLSSHGYTSRWLGAYSLIDTRSTVDDAPEFDPSIFATANPDYVSVYLRMNDVEGGLVNRIKELKGVNMESLRVAERPELDLTIGLVVDIHRDNKADAMSRLNGGAIWLNETSA